MVALRWIGGALLAMFASLVIVSNVVGSWRASRRGGGYSSFPFLGGLVGAAALLALPAAKLHRWWWVPLLVDPYSVPLLVLWMVDRLRRGGNKRP